MSGRFIAGVVLFLSFAACATAELTGPPAYDSGAPSCGSDPVMSCDAATPSQNSCTGAPDASGNARRLPVDAGFAPGCQAYFVAQDCSSQGYCFCSVDDGGTANWRCPP